MTINTDQEITFDVLTTELYDAIKMSNEAVLEAISQTQNPLELVALLSEYVQYTSEITMHVTDVIVDACTVTSGGLH